VTIRQGDLADRRYPYRLQNSRTICSRSFLVAATLLFAFVRTRGSGKPGRGPILGCRQGRAAARRGRSRPALPVVTGQCSRAAIVGLALLSAPQHGQATPITDSFSVVAISGPLKGLTENGTFAYDSTSVVSNSTVLKTGLLTALQFSWNGISYNSMMANTGTLSFDANGNLAEAVFGDDCDAGPCTVVPGTNDWYIEAFPVNPPAGFQYSTPGGGIWAGTVTLGLQSAPISEPSSLALFLIGIVVLTASNLPALHQSRVSRRVGRR
jgi:hypothetical protein